MTSGQTQSGLKHQKSVLALSEIFIHAAVYFLIKALDTDDGGFSEALLFVVVGIAWVSKVTVFTTEAQWTEGAELPGTPGLVVATTLGLFYLTVFLIAFWPGKRQAKGEIHDVEHGHWKETDDEQP